MKFGKFFDELIHMNICMWHEITKIKDLSGTLRSDLQITAKEHVNCALKVRALNAKRSAKRWDIDRQTGIGANETKINAYTEEEG